METDSVGNEISCFSDFCIFAYHQNTEMLLGRFMKI